MEYRARAGKSHTLRIPANVEKKGLPVDATHNLRVGYKQTPLQFVACAGIPNVTFDYSHSFIRPFAEKHLAKLKDAVTKNPDATMMIFGHTDLMKDGKTGKALSERRAKSAFAMLTRKPEYWVGKDPDKAWGADNAPRLSNMKPFYDRCEKEGIPILCHCSPGGVYSYDRQIYYDLADSGDHRAYERMLWFDRTKRGETPGPKAPVFPSVVAWGVETPFIGE